MTKQTGLGDDLIIGGYRLGGDIGSLSRIGGGNGPLEVTGIDKSAPERIGGKRDGSIAFSAWFNPTAGRAHDRLSNLPTADEIVTYFRGTATGAEAASLVGKQLNYDAKRGDDGSLAFDVEAQANGFGLEWGRNLGFLSQAAPGNAAGVDFAAPSAFGLQAYLHIFAFTGTDVTVKLQESSDDGGADAYTDVAGGAFALATGVGAQRIATATNLAVERWLRVVTTGTFSALACVVSVARNLTAPSF